MFLLKLRTAAAVIIALAGFGAGALPLLQKTPFAPPRADRNQGRPELVAQRADNAVRREAPDETGPPPDDLAWVDVAPGDRLRVLEPLVEQARGNYEKIKTWRGTYAYEARQHLDERFVAQLLSGPRSDGPAPPTVKPEALTQVSDSVLRFAIDTGRNALYRDVETSRMRFLKPGTDEEVKIPNVGPADHRSIVTPMTYLVFNPKERSTSAFLPDHPEAKMKRRAERFPAAEARSREGGRPDPRAFFKFDTANFLWSGLERYARALRGELGAEQKKVFTERITIDEAEGPGGTWYRQRLSFKGGPGPNMYFAMVWSPEAGNNPVRLVITVARPDGPLQTTIEWRWKQIGGIYVPSQFWETHWNASDGGLSRELKAQLGDCTLNADLPPHQFDEGGLGLSDGDLVLNHPERVAYIVKGGKPVKLAAFGEGSVLRTGRPAAEPVSAGVPALAGPVPPKGGTPTGKAKRLLGKDGQAGSPASGTAEPRNASAARADARPSGRIYTTASLDTNRSGRPVASVVAVDPETGNVTKVFENSPGRLRVSPDGRSVAYVWGDLSPTAPPDARFTPSLWIRPLTPGAEPRRVAGPAGVKEGDLPV